MDQRDKLERGGGGRGRERGGVREAAQGVE